MHYICNGGCGGESSAIGVCQMEGCKKEGEPLISCECTDGTHKIPPLPEKEEKDIE